MNQQGQYIFVVCLGTLPETNVAPENRPLEKEIPIGNHHFQVPCYFQGGYIASEWAPTPVIT